MQKLSAVVLVFFVLVSVATLGYSEKEEGSGKGRNTLPGLVDRAGVPKGALFDEKMQDILALQLMKERGINPWVGPRIKALPHEKQIVELARKDKLPRPR